MITTADFVTISLNQLFTIGHAAYQAGENADVHGLAGVRRIVANLRREAGAIRKDIDFRNLTVTGKDRDKLMARYAEVMDACKEAVAKATNL